MSVVYLKRPPLKSNPGIRELREFVRQVRFCDTRDLAF
jgi:hypothetical protein